MRATVEVMMPTYVFKFDRPEVYKAFTADAHIGMVQSEEVFQDSDDALAKQRAEGILILFRRQYQGKELRPEWVSLVERKDRPIERC